MSGLVKAKKYDWKDSNMALFGSDTEKKVKKESAESEPAWEGAGQDVGIQIWRIVKFKVEKWPKENYGKFYNGDSYIILKTYKEEETEELLYDVHFWIGQYSTQDEYGTAAYKTVELDTFLDDKPVQHREVMNHESALFKGYFPTLELLKGGADTGFNRVQPTEYQPRLIRVKKQGRKTECTEIEMKRKLVTSDDVYVLDNGLEIIQWNGEQCNKDEKFKATQWVSQLRSERGGKPTLEVVDADDSTTEHRFYRFLKDEDGEDDDDDEVDGVAEDKTHELYKVSNDDGSLDMELAKSGDISLDNFQSDDVFIFDTKEHCFVWIGSKASIDERKNAMTYAHNYLMKTDHPTVPVTCLAENKHNKEFETALAA